jgi:hypothetical protein
MERLLKERPRVDVENDEDDQSLAARAKSDRDAFGLLYDRYLIRVYGYCRRHREVAVLEDDSRLGLVRRDRLIDFQEYGG